MDAPFVEVTFELGALDADWAYAACAACGAVAVTFTDAGDTPVLEPLPGEFRLWSQTRVCALFPEETHSGGGALIRALSTTLGRSAEALHTRAVADKVWEREWLKDFHALRFGERLWICPRHERVADPAARVGEGPVDQRQPDHAEEQQQQSDDQLHSAVVDVEDGAYREHDRSSVNGRIR